MLRYSSHPLPAEIYDMIYSHLSLNHLAAIQKTCRILFRVTCPYVWRSVDIESLLLLLPGSIKETGKGPASRLEITTPSPIPPDYFIRFFHYARFVTCIKITPQFLISGTFEEELSEVAILVTTTGHLLLPHLRTAHLTMLEDPRRFDDDYQDYHFWIDALVPNTIQHISFQAVWNENESLLQALLFKAPQLTNLEFAPDQEERLPAFYKQIVGPDKIQNVQHLRYTGSIMYSEVLLWFAEMRQLSSLELLIDPGDSEEPLSLPEVSYPNNAFHNLATLKVYTSDHGDTVEECNLLKQLWKTPLVRHLTCVEIMLSSPIYPDMKEFDQFMTILVTHSPKVSSLLLRASGSPEHFPEITIEVLESARRLPIRTLNVQSPIHLGAEQPLFKSFGGTFARLEDLDLSSTAVEVSDLLSAHGYLPQLRYLNIGVWQTKTNKKKLERALFPKNTGPWIVPTQRPLGTSLLIGFRKRNSAPRICAYNLDFFDIDLLAMLLAVRWANIHVHGDLLADRMESLRSRIDLWRGKACRNWPKLVALCTLLCSKRYKGSLK